MVSGERTVIPDAKQVSEILLGSEAVIGRGDFGYHGIANLGAEPFHPGGQGWLETVEQSIWKADAVHVYFGFLTVHGFCPKERR